MLSFRGTVSVGQSFGEALPGGATFALTPREDGWDIVLRQPWSSEEERFSAVVVRPPAVNYTTSILCRMPSIKLDEVQDYPPTLRFGVFAISEEQFAEAGRFVKALQENRHDKEASREFARLRKRMGSYQVEFFRLTGADGAVVETGGGRSVEFRVKMAVPKKADGTVNAIRRRSVP